MAAKIQKTTETRLEFYLNESEIEDLILDYAQKRLMKLVGKAHYDDYDSGAVVFSNYDRGVYVTITKRETQEEEM